MKLISILVLLTSSAFAAERVNRQITPVAPVRFEKRGAIYFADFGEDAYGSLKIDVSTSDSGAALPPELKVRLGEKLDASGAIDRKPGGFVSFREGTMKLQADKHVYQLQLPEKTHPNGNASEQIPDVGEIAPFRYAEIEGASLPRLEKTSIIQLFVHAPFDDNASSFESSDETLNAVWHLCKHTMEATSAFGIYIDGDRERTPYEADAYINQLSFYACDLDPRVARCTFDYLLQHPTWPTEWSFHVPMIAAEDYMATGDIELARDNWDALKAKLMTDKARTDGLLRAGAIVDWPMGYRDGYNGGKKIPGDRYQLGPEYNTVVNAFYYHALQQMALLSRALKKENDANEFESKAKQVYESFNRLFFDKVRGLYTDGEGSGHISLHGNMFPLEFGLVPEPCKAKVADYVESRGMACSVYGAQYLLEAMFGADKDKYAIELMTAKSEHSWWHMMEMGSTMTLEAWDTPSKLNLDWNHAWGSAPANIISRYVLGVRPLEPGYSKILIAPQPGALKWIRGKVPTPQGAVSVSWNSDTASLDIEVPPGATASVELPSGSGGGSDIILDGRIVKAKQGNATLMIDGISAGRHHVGLMMKSAKAEVDRIANGPAANQTQAAQPIALSSSPATQPAGDPRWLGQLPGGAVVELLGVSQNPAKDKRWWSPDGRMLTAPPEHSPPANTVGDLSIPGCDFFVIVRDVPFMRPQGDYEMLSDILHHPPDPVAPTTGPALRPGEWQVDFKWTSMQETWTDRVFPPIRTADGFKTSDIYVLSQSFPKSQDRTTIRLGFAVGPWETVATDKTDGASNALSLRGIHGSALDVSFGEPFESDINHDGSNPAVTANITVAHNLPANQQAQVVAILADGKEAVAGRSPETTNGHVMQITQNFRRGAGLDEKDLLQVKDIKEIRLETRMFQWVEFKDVPLHPIEGARGTVPLSTDATPHSAAPLVVHFVDEQGKPLMRKSIGMVPVSVGYSPQIKGAPYFAEDDGTISIASLGPGWHEFVVRPEWPDPTFVQFDLPADGLTRTVVLKPEFTPQPRPDLNVDIEPSIEKGKHLIRVAITNNTAAPYTLSETDLALVGTDWRIFPPASQNHAGLVIPPKDTPPHSGRGRDAVDLMFDWEEYCAKGLWAGRYDAFDGKGPSGPNGDGSDYYRVEVGSSLSLPVLLPKPAIESSLQPAGIPDVATFENLLAQTPGRVGDWDCRVGLADPGPDAGPIEQVYCLADWMGAGDPKPIAHGEPDALGPLSIRLKWDDDKIRMALKSEQISASKRGTRFLFLSSVMLARKGITSLTVCGPDADQPIWERQFKIDAPRVSPWQRLAQWRPDRTLDANVSKPRAAVATFKGAFPVLAGDIKDNSMWKGELPGILHADTSQLNLSIDDKAFAVDSTDRKMLDWPDETLLARWWVNGKPIVPAVSDEAEAQLREARQIRFTKHVELRFGLPANIENVKPGDTIALQVMYSPGHIAPVTQNRYGAPLQMEMTHGGGEEFQTPVVSNKLEFKLTPELLAMVQIPPPDGANGQSGAGPASTMPASHHLEFRLVGAAGENVDGDDAVDPTNGQRLRVLKRVELDERDVASAAPAKNSDGTLRVDLELTDAGAVKFAMLTSANIDHRLAILLDGKLLIAPTIRTRISRSMRIDGGLTGLTQAQVDSLVRAVGGARETPQTQPATHAAEAPMTVDEALAAIAQEPQVQANAPAEESQVRLRLESVIDKYEPTKVEETRLLAAMQNAKTPSVARLCIASFLLRVDNEAARKLVGDQLAGAEPGEGAAALVYDIAPGRAWSIQHAIAFLNRSHSEAVDSDFEVMTQICDRLATSGDHAAADALLETARASLDPTVIYSLQKLEDPRVIPVLSKIIEGDNGQLRHEAAYVLLQKKWAGLGAVLVKHLGPDPEEEYSTDGDAADLLVELKDPATLGPMRAYVAQHPEAFEVKCAIVKLTAKTHDEMILGLVALAGDEEKRTGRPPMKLWFELGEEDHAAAAVAPIRRYMVDEGHIDLGGILALENIATPDAIDAMIQMLGRDYSKVSYGKTAGNQASWTEALTSGLTRATGQQFGSDMARWQQWWKEKYAAGVGAARRDDN